jgi:hypothetical protein
MGSARGLRRVGICGHYSISSSVHIIVRAYINKRDAIGFEHEDDPVLVGEASRKTVRQFPVQPVGLQSRIVRISGDRYDGGFDRSREFWNVVRGKSSVSSRSGTQEIPASCTPQRAEEGPNGFDLPNLTRAVVE